MIDRYLSRLKRVKGEDHGTYQQYKLSIEDFDSFCDAKDATALDIEDYCLHLAEDGYSSATIRLRYMALRALYKFAIKIDMRDENPCDDVDLDSLNTTRNDEHDDSIPYVTKEEVDTMLDNIDKEHYVRDRLLILIGFQTGLRKSELRNIKVENIDQDECSISVYRSKNDDFHTVYYQQSLNRTLDIWLEQKRPLLRDSPYLFPSNSAPQISSNTIRTIVKDAAEPINEPISTMKDGRERMRITPHALRHGHAVHSLKSGVPLPTVQSQLGHASVEMTRHYLQLTGDDRRDLYQAFED